MTTSWTVEIKQMQDIITQRDAEIERLKAYIVELEYQLEDAGVEVRSIELFGTAEHK